MQNKLLLLYENEVKVILMHNRIYEWNIILHLLKGLCHMAIAVEHDQTIVKAKVMWLNQELLCGGRN